MWGTKEEIERRRRIRVSIASYAYEFLNTPITSDSEYDKESYLINLAQNTDNPEMDKWFRENFQPSTGMWIRNHPNLIRLDELARWVIKEMRL